MMSLDSTKYLILLRGLPGSGKTTLANVLSENGKYPIYSIDDYFTDKKTGNYKFEHTQNHIAYKTCEENTEKSLKEGAKKVIVHNTFTMDWEMKIYFELAKKYNYIIFITTVENYHHGKNTHDIPIEQIRRMAEKYKVRLLPEA
jgi:predicted kinase